MAKSDLVAALTAAGRSSGGQKLKLAAMFGDRPDVLDGVKQARANGASHLRISRILSGDGEYVSEAAVRNWLLAQGIE